MTSESASHDAGDFAWRARPDSPTLGPAGNPRRGAHRPTQQASRLITRASFCAARTVPQGLAKVDVPRRPMRLTASELQHGVAGAVD